MNTRPSSSRNKVVDDALRELSATKRAKAEKAKQQGRTPCATTSLRKEKIFVKSYSGMFRGMASHLSDAMQEGNKWCSKLTAVRKAVAAGETQHVAWAYRRENGGRGFGFTGGHNHLNWGNDDYRKTVLNAILWAERIQCVTNHGYLQQGLANSNN